MSKLVGLVGSGRVARDPFDPRQWSSSSYFFFTELKRRGALHRAFGVEVPAWRRALYLARNFHFRRAAWREHFYMDVGYRNALTRLVQQRLEPADFAHDFLQLGAMFDGPSLVRGGGCFSYNDGNLAELLRSPYAPKSLNARKVDRALAYEKHVAQGLRKIFCMSEYLRQSFIRDFDVPAERVVTVGCGINLEALPEPEPNKPYDRREVLFIGVDFPRKGGWELLKAFRGVAGRFPDARLHLVGPRELTIPPELQKGVIYHGFLSKFNPPDQAKLTDLFRRCCLFVMPSLYEPFGIAPLEAMAHWLPCIVTNRWALKEMVTPGTTGDLVECGSVDDLEAKLTALLADPDGLKRMGEAGRQMVLDYYTWDKVVQRVLAEVDAAAPNHPDCPGAQAAGTGSVCAGAAGR
jgi:glycosyltransferase involved in cell wall biosynthesis